MLHLHQRGPGALAKRAVERAGHGTTDPEHVDAIEQMIEHADLGRDLRPADDGDHRFFGVVHHAAEHLEFARHELAGNRGEQMRDPLG